MTFTKTLAAGALCGACAVAYAATASEPPLTQTTRDERMAAALQDYQAQPTDGATPSPSMQRQQPRMKHHGHPGHAKKEGAAASARK
jgi:hypothetical protein